ncbi:MAG: PKD domain-containing protein [Phycisphaerae bacterium]|jgi:predicted esterase|nr:PKD domain-containing protein [Phycisphaerae bacterium]
MWTLQYLKKLSVGLTLAMLAGCAVTQSQVVPKKVLHLVDEDFGRDYFIYLPTSYGKKPLPLVITCHGTNPWDSARMQINEWKHLAERYQFVVIAPGVSSARGVIPPSPSAGIAILKKDEEFILKITEGFLNNPNIDQRAIMITSWSAGGFPMYFTGLRHPEIFRVVAARQANFVREYYTPDIPRFDPYQPILIFYGENDLPILKADSKVAYDFLSKAGQKNLFLMSMKVGHTRHPEVALKFFGDAIRMYPRPTIIWAKLLPGGQCRIRFDSCLVDPPDDGKIYWDFGDGDSGVGRVVDHTYKSPGKYALAVMHAYRDKTIRFVGRIEVRAGSFSVISGEEK